MPRKRTLPYPPPTPTIAVPLMPAMEDSKAHNRFTVEKNEGRGPGAPRVTCNFTPSEYKRLRAFCKSHGVTASGLIRTRLSDVIAD